MGSSIRPELDPVAAYKQRYLQAAPQDATAQDPVALYKQKYANGQPEYGKGLATSLAQGATFGLADEALGGIDAVNSLLPKSLGGEGGSLKNLGAKYRATRDRIRGTEAAFAEQNPKTHIAANIAGGLVDAPLFATKGAASLLGRMAQGVDAGIVGGATAGFGASTKPTFGEQVEDAARGAMGGAVLGAALPLAGSAASRVGGKLLDASGRRPVSYANTPRGGVMQSTARAMGVQSVEQRALGLIQQAMDRDGLSLEQAVQKASGAFSLEPNTLMELAGRNMKRLGRSTLTAPGKGSDVMASTLENRARGEEETILGNLYDQSGLGGPTNVRQTVDQLIEQRGNEAQSHYGALRQSAPAAMPELKNLASRPSFKAAYARAQQIAAEEGVPMPALQEVLDGKDVNFQTVDRIKRGLDDLSYRAERGGNVLSGESATDAGGLGPEAISKIKGTRAKFVELADKAFPDYPAARSAFAGKTALADALEQGRKVFTTRPEDAQAYMAALGKSEQEMFRRGAAEAFREKIEGVASGNDITRRVFDKTTDAKRLALVFPDKAGLQSFGERVSAAAQRFKTRNFLGAQSATADKLAELGELAGVGLDDVADLATGNVHGILKRTAAKIAGKGEKSLTEQTGEAVAERLTAGARPGTTVKGVLTELQSHKAEMARRQAGRTGFLNTVSGSTASSNAQRPKVRTP